MYDMQLKTLNIIFYINPYKYIYINIISNKYMISFIECILTHIINSFTDKK